jgi:5'-nucleotidase
VTNPQFEGAARLLHLIGQRLSERPAPSSFFLNINVPSLPLERIPGVRLTTLGRRSYGESVSEEGTGPERRYWISRNRPALGVPKEGTDIWALKNNLVSITPLDINLNYQGQMTELESLLADVPFQLLGHRD